MALICNLERQTAVITGASSGIGRGCAHELAKAGANIVVNYIGSPEAANQVVAEIEELGGDAIAVQADVSDEAQVEAMFAKAVEHYGTVDVLVNNAGLQQDADFTDMTLAQWRKVLDVNLTGQFLCARAAAREFKRRGMRPQVSRALGKIICVSSVHDIIPWAGHVNYATSKGGVMLMMKSIAQELGPDGIRVNSVCPGAVRTPINRSVWESEEGLKKLFELIPTRRIGEVEDIGKVVAFLVSDQADYIHGTNIYVDGGMTLYPGFATGG